MNIISFCLWGSNPKYTIGAIKNAILALDIYPGWKCYFYVSNDVPREIIRELESIGNTTIYNMGDGNWNSMFWRFYPACIKDAVLIVRDTDSRLGHREKCAVDAWLKSDKDFHIMRDHSYHATRILGGMWGVRNNKLYNMQKLIGKFDMKNCYDTDQEFLRSVIYPMICDSVCIHDEFFDRMPFPAEAPKRTHTYFVGQAYDHNDKPLFDERHI